MNAAMVLVFSLVLMNVYVALSCCLRLPRRKPVFLGLAFLFLAFFALQLVVPLFDWSRALVAHQYDSSFYEFAVQSSYLALGIMSCLFVFLLCADVFSLLLWPFLPAPLLRPLGYAALALVFLITLASVVTGLYHAGKIEIARVDLPLKNLPEPFDGFTIAQVSDVHVGRFLKSSFVEEIVSMLDALHPDMIVLTGDLVDGHPEDLAKELKLFAKAQTPYGKYYVTGNHEYYWGAQPWIAEVKKLGFTVLLNENAVVEKGSSRLVLAGVPDPTVMRFNAGAGPNPKKAIEGTAEDSVKILLSHQPRLAAQARALGYAAQLSGHTHAGQYFPFTKMIGFFEPHNKGLYSWDGFKLYVNKGVGFWGPPLRSERGEITLLTLRRE